MRLFPQVCVKYRKTPQEKSLKIEIDLAKLKAVYTSNSVCDFMCDFVCNYVSAALWNLQRTQNCT
jgi:hypothetical protein